MMRVHMTRILKNGQKDEELMEVYDLKLNLKMQPMLLIQPIKDKYSGVTYADLFQLASATAVEEAGGPKIPMKYGRVDVTGPEQCPEEGKLPDAGPPSHAEHLQNVFYRTGLNDQEIVALSGAPTLGRSRPERSGWGKPETKYTVKDSFLWKFSFVTSSQQSAM
ncbi:uncharacterized protein A4U43_C09F14670 [Asparagus officinalis]|uniref:Plant heme peroxidase family profile domain-containing protein n=1 Tax=Asparagus officinalis TaxID=4686 RepID=A0A5P1E7Q2_ASPOF|nr:uncharacterized protein A4U43_C09F14670 [Asparagus officinalis]